MNEVYAAGNQRLSDAIATFASRPGLMVAEFGTRRRFSSDWQGHVVERLANELPEQFLGTSNTWLADKYGVPAIGTNAHELSQVYAALTEARGGNPLDGQTLVIQDWLNRFPSMPVALIDTFTSDITLHDMTLEQVERVKSFRIDSGDEYMIGKKVISFLERRDIDPTTRTLFFSNSLTPQKTVELYDAFEGKIGVGFGVGGHLSNNMGFADGTSLPGLNIVAKAVEVNGQGTVKLSDDSGKHMGADGDVARYKRYVAERLEHPSQS